jgi:putative hydrolase of the HAD superfamily
MRLVLEHSFHRPLEPAGILPALQPLPEIRVIFFDVYGTLFLGMRTEPFPPVGPEADHALAEVIQAAGLKLVGPPEGLSELLAKLIARSQEMLRQSGVDYPEVDIPAIWQTLLEELKRQERLALGEIPPSLPRRLALHWEVVRNPVWPTPGLRESLAELRHRGYQLGIISNAQFYCRILFTTFLGRPLEDLGFDPKLVFFSYEQGWAKPGPRLFELAVQALADRGLSSAQALHVGNDLLQDVIPAQKIGFHTALLAQDRYNLRLGNDEQGSLPVQPNIVATNLAQLLDCLPGKRE